MYNVEDYDYAWLCLTREDVKGIRNPLLNLNEWQTQNFHLHVLSLMRDTRYIAWTTKHLLNINLLPQQSVVLQELWNHSFPMMVCSRGYGKALPNDTPILTEKGWVNIGEVQPGDKVYARDGYPYDIVSVFPQGRRRKYLIRLADGREIGASDDHLWIVKHMGEEKLVTTHEMFMEGRGAGYYIPVCKPIAFEEWLADYRVTFLRKKLGLRHRTIKDVTRDIASNQLRNLIIDTARSMGLVCSTHGTTVHITNDDYVAIQDIVCTSESVEMTCIETESPDHTFIAKDYIVTHNSFLLAVYCMLRCLLIPESKIIIVGAAWRQSRVIYEYMENMWARAPLYRSLCTDGSGPHRDVDRCTMRVNDSFAMAIPLGSGDKIRGLRAHTTIADEFACIDPDAVVETSDGLRRIKDMVEEQDTTLACINKDGEEEIPDKFIETPKQPAYHLRLKNGLWIYASERHQVLLRNGQFKRVVELEPGDELFYESQYRFPIKRKLKRGVPYIIGQVLAVGYLINEHIAQLKDTPQLRQAVEQAGLKYEDGKLDIKELGINPFKVPSEILSASRNELLEFIRGFCQTHNFELDYNVYSGVCHARIYCPDPVMHRDIQTILLKFRVPSWYDPTTRSIRINDYALRRLNELANLSLRFPSVFSVRTVAQDTYDGLVFECGPYNSKSEIDSVFITYAKDYEDGFVVDSVKKLYYPIPLYDFHLPKTHSFYACGFVQHNSIPVEIYETVVEGFSAVSKDPIENHKLAAKRKRMIADGVWTERDEEQYQSRHKNQNIITGTASYGFEPFADYWRKYRSIILSRGDLSKLIDKERADEEGLPDYMKNIDPKEFTVIRIPYELIPEGMMNDAQIARARATMHTGIFNMEYSACLLPETLVMTQYGYRMIGDIQPGDLVLTHEGRFRKVTKKTYRDYRGPIYKLSNGSRITADHPIWLGMDWFERVEEADKICFPQFYVSQAGEIHRLNFADYNNNVDDYGDGENYVVFKGWSRLTVDDRRKMRMEMRAGATAVSMVEKYGITEYEARLIRDYGYKTPSLAPSIIFTDYSLGVLVAYELSFMTSTKNEEVNIDYMPHDKIDKIVKRFNRAIKNADPHATYLKRKLSGSNRYAFKSHVYASVVKKLVRQGRLAIECFYFQPAFIIGLCETLWLFNGGLSAKGGYTYIKHNSVDLLHQLRVMLTRLNIYGEVDCNELRIAGESSRRFWEEFMHTTVPDEFCREDNVKLCYGWFEKNINKEIAITDYVGRVYNLEVEEDNSYCLIEGAVHNCFSDDSTGFFKRSLIEACVAKESNLTTETWPPWCPEVFDAKMRGDPSLSYVFGIDPASEQDNFAIVVLELHKEHARVVYVWTTNRKQFKERKKLGLTDIDDYYGFCVQHIRNLMLAFPCVRIGIDTQGGGYQIAEGLADSRHIREEFGEVPIYPIIEDGKEKDTDRLAGLHIIEYIQFANAEWTSKANHGLRKDMEDRVLLFPRYDAVTLSLAAAHDDMMMDKLRAARSGKVDVDFRLFDTLEECILNIEELKTELTTVVVTRTPSGREHFDTPEIKLGTGKKGRMRKDRYSALVIANMIARSMQREIPAATYSYIGRPAGIIAKKRDGQMYTGNAKLAYNPSVVRLIKKNV